MITKSRSFHNVVLVLKRFLRGALPRFHGFRGFLFNRRKDIFNFFLLLMLPLCLVVLFLWEVLPFSNFFDQHLKSK